MTETHLSDEVVERAARGTCGRDLAYRDCERACLAAGKCVGKISGGQFEDARAALEAARYGELRELLDCARDDYECSNGRVITNDQHWSVKARALLSDIEGT